MSIKKVLFPKGKLHHAYLLVGEKEYWSKVLESELKNYLDLDSLKSSPDIWWQGYESFGIREAHTLIENESRHGFGGKGRFFILEILSITPEAQNALLKTFEEPASESHFFIVARTAEMFLPTLRSRLIIMDSQRARDLEVELCVTESDFEIARKFFKMDLPDRLDFIQKEFLLVQSGKNKEISKNAIIDFVIELEKALRAKINLRQITKDEELALYELEKCQRYLQNPRSSNRLILEHLALILPN